MKIIFNEKEYGSLAEMPPAEREQYQKLLEALNGRENSTETNQTRQTSAGQVHLSTKISREIVCNGTTYQDIDELPAEVRQLLGNPNAAVTGPGTVQVSNSIDHEVLPSETVRHTSYDMPTLHRNRPVFIWWAWVAAAGIVTLLAWLMASMS